nr:MAG TPA: hypothetical protein [Caudoviricetes sp.]
MNVRSGGCGKSSKEDYCEKSISRRFDSAHGHEFYVLIRIPLRHAVMHHAGKRQSRFAPTIAQS